MPGLKLFNDRLIPATVQTLRQGVAGLALTIAALTSLPLVHAQTAPAPAQSPAKAVSAKSGTSVALPDGVIAGPAIEGTHAYTLPNGLKVLLTPDEAQASVTVNMTYLVGSRHENYGETGMAHLLEHMLFRGTPSLPNALAEFSKRGLKANGTTSSDRTNYYASFAADPALLDWYVRWQADVMVNATIARSDLDAEMTVVRNEMEAGENNPFETLMQKTQAAAYQWHSYANDTIGARSDVENVDIEQLRAFYRQYYQPDNAILIISGKFDLAQTLALVADAFKGIPKPERTLPPEYTVEPVQEGQRQVVVKRNGGTPLVVSQYHIPQGASPDFVALDLGVSIIADVPSGRLYKALVDKRLAALSFGFARPMQQPGYALFGAQLESGADPYKTLSAMNAAIADVAQTPFTQQELDRVKSRAFAQWNQVYADPAHLTSALSEAAALGDWRLFYWQRDQVEQTTLENIQRVTTAYLVPDNRTEGIYLPTDQPTRAPAATPINIEQMLADYTGRALEGNTAAFDATPENIDAQTQREPLALSDGTQIDMALLPKPTRGNRVEAKLLMQFGDAASLAGKSTVAAATASLLDHGSKTLSRQNIQDKFTELQADVGLGGGNGVVVAEISVPGSNLPQVIALVTHLLREPVFPADELDTYKTQVITSIRSGMTEPGALASRALARHDNPWPKEDPRYTPTFEEALQRVEALNQKALADFHAQFYGTGTLRFSAIGTFDADAVRQALKAGFSDWKKAPAYTRLDDPWRDVTPKSFTINTPDKANAVYVASLPLKLRDDNPEFQALYVANYLLGGSSRSRLWERIRVTEGISYSVGSGVNASAYEPSGEWSMSAILAPENSDRFRAALNDELNKALNSGFSDEEVKEAVQALMNLRRLNRSNDEILAAVWINYMQEGRSFAWSAQIDDLLSKMTAKDVNAALRKYLKPDAFSNALAGDFDKNKP